MNTVENTVRAAHAAAGLLSLTAEETRNNALRAVAQALQEDAPSIFEANREDLSRARSENLSAPLLSRLSLDEKKLSGLVEGLDALCALPDPVGRETIRTELAPGLVLTRKTCPIGTIGVVFESRPDALVQISSLCLKSANACLLKGGREALATNRALFASIVRGTAAAGIPQGWAAMFESREEVQAMLSLDREIDLLIPRGSNEFVRKMQQSTRIPVMGHSSGLCHLYVDKDADIDMALAIAVDAKTQAPATCNSIETLLVHEAIAPRFLPLLGEAMREKGVEIRGDDRVCALLPSAVAATQDDWDEEYLALVLSVKTVSSLAEAVAHVNAHGSRHTDAIVTSDAAAAERFISAVDSADAFWNCSTRFADGFRFGLGAEVGISTGKLHARGPVGLEGLTTYKWILCGSGQTVAPFVDGKEHFTHRALPCR